MGTFNFDLTSAWDVAHHHGHSAFQLLKIAYDKENEYVRDSEKLKSLPWGQLDYLEVGARNHFLTTEMFRISSASIMMFQAMMEALINHSLRTEPTLSSSRSILISGGECRCLEGGPKHALSAVARA